MLSDWVRQDQVDAGTGPGTTSEELAELKRLKKENAEPRRANERVAAARTVLDRLKRPRALGRIHAIDWCDLPISPVPLTDRTGLIGR